MFSLIFLVHTYDCRVCQDGSKPSMYRNYGLFFILCVIRQMLKPFRNLIWINST